MAKPKKVIAEVVDRVKAEDLEIISIGCLYNGPWEKKYWSSSRGKDRYPYPVGYHAIRAHNGRTCKIEIHEGPKGPSFMVTSADGHTFSGQTPDIACEKFQKKCCSHMKTWHGKRLLCKIDGVEFFGFKNSFVHRLLRELAANDHERAEEGLLSSNFCNEPCTKNDTQLPDACVDPDLQGSPHFTKKRNRRCETTSTKSIGKKELKKPRSQNLTFNAEASTSEQVNKRNDKPRSSTPPSATGIENDLHELQGAVSASLIMNSLLVKENDRSVSAKDRSFESIDISEHLLERAVPDKEVSKFAGYDNCISNRLANSLSEHREPFHTYWRGPLYEKLNLSQLGRSQNFSALRATRDKAGEVLVVMDSLDVENIGICTPDTLDFVQDDSTRPQIIPDKSDGLRENLAHNAIYEGLVTESHPEEEIEPSGSNMNSEKNDFDSVGQEFKAMMTFLLPQAVPLLKTKNVTATNSESFPYRVNLHKETNEVGHSMVASSTATMLMGKTCGVMEDIQSQNVEPESIIPSSEPHKSVIRDSFEDDQSEDQLINQDVSSSKVVEADQPSQDKVTNLSNSLKKLVVAEVWNKRTQKGIVESLDCRSPSKEVISGKVQVDCATSDDCYAGIGTSPAEKDLKVTCDCTEGNTGASFFTGLQSATDANQGGIGSSSPPSKEDNSAKTADAETSCIAHQVRVYSRKKVLKTGASTKNFDGPLSESIICRNSGDDCVFKLYGAKSTPTNEISQMSPSDADLCEENTSGTNSLKRQSHGSPVISRSSPSFCSPEGKFISSSIHPSILDNSVSHPVKGQGNLTEINPPVTCHEKETNPHQYDKLSTEEDKDSQNLKVQMDLELNNELEGIVELVGCYSHPMPVLSVLLRSIENKIYICVSCGLLVDKKRTLFVYKVAVQGPEPGFPSFVGHTSLVFPSSKHNFGRELTEEKSCLLLTPDGQCLVFLGSIRTPYCREGKVDCLCSSCTSECIEENTVKIVQIKSGYVSVVAKLKTHDRVLCILVIEPDSLVAVGESGQLYLWEMNLSWSSQIKESVIPVHDCIFPCIVELQRIPKCTSLVVGHNGFGEFGIWDISRRVFISRFSAPSTSIYEFLPLSLFSWPRNGPHVMRTNEEEDVDKIIAATELWFSEQSGNSSSFLPPEGEGIALWLFVSTVCSSDAQQNRTSSSCPSTPDRFWRLALLVKNMVVLGDLLDSRASVIGASAGLGIIGTHGGLVFMWDISSGTKLGTLHQFKGQNVSCIATDDSRSRVLAVAGDDGKLLVYLHKNQNMANEEEKDEPVADSS